MGNIVLTFFVGVCFGLLFTKMKIPGGMMVGSIVSVSALSVFFNAASMPDTAKLIAQIVAGAFIGCSIDKADLMKMRDIYKPASVLLLAMLILNIILGFLIYMITPMDLLTSLLCTVPGGVSEMPLIAADMGADSAKIAVLQFFRMVAGVGIFPGMTAWVTKRERTSVRDSSAASPDAARDADSDPQGKTEVDAQEAKAQETKTTETQQREWKKLVFILAISAVSGIIGKALKVPSGSLLFPLFAVIALKFAGVSVIMPRWIRRVTQVLSGAYIGSSITYQDVLELGMLAVPTLVILAGYFINNLVTGRLLAKRFGFSMAEGMLAVNPAGASDMALISADIGVRSPKVNVLQIIRMLSAVSIFPQIMRLIAMLFS